MVATRDLPGPAGDRITVKSAGSGPAQLYSLLNIRAPMQYGDFRWNDDGVPAGPLWVRVGLRHQTLSVFRGGHEIGTAVILYGADNKPTPLGTFPILARLKDHRSSQYDAPMPFTLRLTGDGVAIHGTFAGAPPRMAASACRWNLRPGCTTRCTSATWLRSLTALHRP